MSLRPNAPYRDQVEQDGTVLIYEGHDQPSRAGQPNPKNVDQPQFLPSGRLTENGKFHAAAVDYKNGKRNPDVVRVYEKLKPGIWSDNGFFHLVDSWVENDGTRNVFKFKLLAIDGDYEDADAEAYSPSRSLPRRLIPTSVKVEVWKRDDGKCVICQATDELHFDHILPYSKGGTSMKVENVQLLCARHNLQKSAKIQ